MRSYSAAKNIQSSGVRPFDGSAPIVKEGYSLAGLKSHFSQKNRHEESKIMRMAESSSDEEEPMVYDTGFNLKPAKQLNK